MGQENEGNIGVTLEWEGEGNHETLEDGVRRGLSRLWGATLRETGKLWSLRIGAKSGSRVAMGPWERGAGPGFLGRRQKGRGGARKHPTCGDVGG